MTREPLAIGCAAGFGGDRTDAAGPVVDTLIARGGPAVLIFEVLAERTLALAQLERRANPEPRLCPAHGADAAAGPAAVPRPRHPDREQLRRRQPARRRPPNPADRPGARHRATRAWRSSRATTCPTPAAGSSCASTSPRQTRAASWSAPTPTSAPRPSRRRCGPGAGGGHRAGRRPVAGGRAGDGPLRLGRERTGTTLARATIAGHLIECGAQVTGGYFADPGLKDVPDLHAVGFPIVEIDADGAFVDRQGRRDRRRGGLPAR